MPEMINMNRDPVPETEEYISETGRKYHTAIEAGKSMPKLRLGELMRYRELIGLFTRRAFVLSYKQTILGPLWVLIRPLAGSIVQMVVFGMVAALGTDGIPMILFYLFGNALWGFFSTCVSSNANTFTSNAYLFGKVYFPRMTVPLSNVLTGLIGFGLQLILGVVLYIFFLARGQVEAPGVRLLLVIPILIVLAMMGLGVGLIASSLTTKYRDLQILVSFGLGLWMYLTPVVYPLSLAAGSRMELLLKINPMTAPTELFRYAVFGKGMVLPGSLIYSLIFAVVVLIAGMLLFDHVERTFMDTV